MRSTITGRTYQEVRVIFLDAATHTASDLEGTVYRELEDRSWIGRSGGTDMPLRYLWHYAHAGGVVLKPFAELVDGEWVNLLTGKREPDVAERRFA